MAKCNQLTPLPFRGLICSILSSSIIDTYLVTVNLQRLRDTTLLIVCLTCSSSDLLKYCHNCGLAPCQPRFNSCSHLCESLEMSGQNRFDRSCSHTSEPEMSHFTRGFVQALRFWKYTVLTFYIALYLYCTEYCFNVHCIMFWCSLVLWKVFTIFFVVTKTERVNCGRFAVTVIVIYLMCRPCADVWPVSRITAVIWLTSCRKTNRSKVVLWLVRVKGHVLQVLVARSAWPLLVVGITTGCDARADILVTFWVYELDYSKAGVHNTWSVGHMWPARSQDAAR